MTCAHFSGGDLLGLLGAEGDGLGALAEGVPSQQAAKGVECELGVIQGVAGDNGLVEVGVEGHALHVLALAHLHKRLARRVGPVEHLHTAAKVLARGKGISVALHVIKQPLK